MREVTGFAVTIATLIVLTGRGHAGDWPQYGGPRGTQISEESGLRWNWEADGPPVLWTIELGKGYGGATVADGTVFVMDRITGEKDVFASIRSGNRRRAMAGRIRMSWLFAVPRITRRSDAN